MIATARRTARVLLAAVIGVMGKNIAMTPTTAMAIPPGTAMMENSRTVNGVPALGVTLREVVKRLEEAIADVPIREALTLCTRIIIRRIWIILAGAATVLESLIPPAYVLKRILENLILAMIAHAVPAPRRILETPSARTLATKSRSPNGSRWKAAGGREGGLVYG
ncbi:hypothetical protein HOY80DRAFT_991790 [Tuber brumale]|nr:hypothetical protein HOY80DRAFT_991790 [Tuber brumale]